jgi:hypothetical protein
MQERREYNNFQDKERDKRTKAFKDAIKFYKDFTQKLREFTPDPPPILHKVRAHSYQLPKDFRYENKSS